MYLQSIATASPPHSFTQKECWSFIMQSEVRHILKDRSLAILQKVLLNDNGIAKRHFALNDLARIFDYRSDDLATAFEREAPALAARALAAALERGGVLPAQIDALFICTCTGYLCPGLSSYVSEKLRLKTDAYLHDAVGTGCGAAIPVMRAADHFLRAHPGATAACVAVEICSAAFYLDDDPGVLISACLFGDGAAAAIWTGRQRNDEPRAFGFDTLHWPEHREMLRFEARNGKLRNRLAKAVPATAARAVRKLFDRRGERPVGQVIAHPGGRDVLVALTSTLPDYELDESSRVLRQFGNMSSPSVLFALEERLKDHSIEDDLWLVSFGAGFSSHSCRLGTVPA
ncbi:MAG: stilbene synthase [Opitutales bacterium]